MKARSSRDARVFASLRIQSPTGVDSGKTRPPLELMTGERRVPDAPGCTTAEGGATMGGQNANGTARGVAHGQNLLGEDIACNGLKLLVMTTGLCRVRAWLHAV